MSGSASILALSLAFGVGLMPALAHNGEEHGDEHTEVREMSITEMEQMISLMQQLVVLLTAMRTLQPSMIAPVSAIHEMEEHHDEHSVEHEDAVTDHEAESAKLVIEVEPHNNQTHVHVRYTDKPEEMFFVTVALSDEEGIVSAVSARTGLSQDEVRVALKFMQ